jgi:hypothetical protein
MQGNQCLLIPIGHKKDQVICASSVTIIKELQCQYPWLNFILRFGNDLSHRVVFGCGIHIVECA